MISLFSSADIDFVEYSGEWVKNRQNRRQSDRTKGLQIAINIQHSAQYVLYGFEYVSTCVDCIANISIEPVRRWFHSFPVTDSSEYDFFIQFESF